MTLTKTQTHQPLGTYNPTTIDERKANADFRLVSVSPYYIIWKDGGGETVTKRQLNKLQKNHTWETDF